MPTSRAHHGGLPDRVTRVDSAISTAINRARTPRWLDAGLRGLSRAADHGVLSTAVAVLLFATGRRRAALRGIGSLAAASLIANVLGKHLIGGDRPGLDAVPLARRIRRRPASPSFPSGHTASAAAFATGVVLESAGAGAAAAPLAAGIAYSRVHVGAHWLSDVVGGALLGIGVAVAGALLIPARPDRVRAARSPEVELPALADGAGLLILLNPASGRDAHRPDPTAELGRLLPAAVVHRLAPEDGLEAVLADHPDAVALGAYGGDGTVSAVAAIARRQGMPLMVLPGGTFNHFGRAIGVTGVTDAIEAVRTGRGRAVDVGEITFDDAPPVTVLNTASVGIYPAFVSERERYERRLGKPLASVIASARVFASNDSVSLRLDGRDERVWSVFVGIGRYGRGLAPLAQRRLDDGVLDVRILHARAGAVRTRGATALALGRRAAATIDRLPGTGDEPLSQSFEATELTVSTRPDAVAGSGPGFAHDGEASMNGEGGVGRDGVSSSTIRIVPLGLRVYSAAVR